MAYGPTLRPEPTGLFCADLPLLILILIGLYFAAFLFRNVSGLGQATGLYSKRLHLLRQEEAVASYNVHKLKTRSHYVARIADCTAS